MKLIFSDWPIDFIFYALCFFGFRISYMLLMETTTLHTRFIVYKDLTVGFTKREGEKE